MMTGLWLMAAFAGVSRYRHNLNWRPDGYSSGNPTFVKTTFTGMTLAPVLLFLNQLASRWQVWVSRRCWPSAAATANKHF